MPPDLLTLRAVPSLYLPANCALQASVGCRRNAILSRTISRDTSNALQPSCEREHRHYLQLAIQHVVWKTRWVPTVTLSQINSTRRQPPTSHELKRWTAIVHRLASPRLDPTPAPPSFLLISNCISHDVPINWRSVTVTLDQLRLLHTCLNVAMPNLIFVVSLHAALYRGV